LNHHLRRSVEGWPAETNVDVISKERPRLKDEQRSPALPVCLLVALVSIWLAAACAGAQQATPSGAQAQPGAPSGGGIIDVFDRGGLYMWPLLACAVAGLAVIAERLYTLQRARINTRKLMSAIVTELRERGVEGAKEICLNTRGPIAAILHAGLSKVDHGPAAVEKAIENSGAVELAFLSRGLPILASVISIGPLLGFLGTVSGMINAFQHIAAADHASARIVARGISEALITTMAGLTIAVPAQIAYNYFLARIDGFVVEMEETSVELLDTLAEMRPRR